MHGDFFFQAFVFLAAAVVAVPIAKKLGLGSVLGYLLAGVAIGPFVLGLVGQEGKDILHFAEFGVVLMLFLVGLELEPAVLWRLRTPILGLGGLQVLATTLLVAAAALAFGTPLKAAIAIGMTLAMSSTAIVLQSLAEKGLMKTSAGQSSFSVLLFQDLAVIPMLAIFPLLASGPAETAAAEHGTFIDHYPPAVQTLIVLGAVASIIVGGRFLVAPAFRAIARTRLRELFTAAALLLVVGISLLMGQVGLSPALGTFLAGVVLAGSEYRHELESDIEPFKGLLLGLFFLAVGASIDFALIASRPGTVLLLVFGVLALKFGVLLALAKFFKLSIDQGLLFAFGLAQVGEFAFVLLSFASQNRVIEGELAALLVAVVAITMALTPLLLLFNEKVIDPRFGVKEEAKAADEIDEQHAVIIAGFGNFGQVVGRLLRANGIHATLLDNDSDRVDLLRRIGFKVFYGDATRHDLLIAAGAEKAKLIVLAIDDPEKVIEQVHTIRRHFPQLEILARARGRHEAYELIEAGVKNVYREGLDTSLRVGIDALRHLGFRAHQAHRAAAIFRCHDEEALQELAASRRDQDTYINMARSRVADLERLLQVDREDAPGRRDQGWDSESLREDVRQATFARKEGA